MLPGRERGSESRGSPVRWALPVLFVLVLAVWLVSQTLLPAGDDDMELAYSEVKELVRDSPERIEHLELRPDDRRIVVRFRNGSGAESAYPSTESAAAFEEVLDEQGVTYSSEAGGGSAWSSFRVYLLPFVLFFGFWIFLRWTSRRGAWNRDGPGGSPPGTP